MRLVTSCSHITKTYVIPISPALHSYPHINQRSISDIFELNRTRKVIVSVENQLQKLQPKLANARRRLDTLRCSYKEAGDAYHDSEWYIQQTSKLRIYEAHVTRIEEEVLERGATLKSFRDPVHPIRRCNTDIIRLIFEWILIDHCNPYRLRLPTATIFTQVCYRWREIALSMPRLWSWLEVSLRRDANDIEAYWSRTIERIRSCPVIIHITDLSLSDGTKEAIEKCRLDLIPHIQTLYVVLDRPGALTAFQTCQLHPPAGDIEALDIRTNWDNSRDVFGSPTVDTPFSPGPLYFLDRFPTITELRLNGFNAVTYTGEGIFPSVTHLSITNSEYVDLDRLCKVFPMVKQLSFSACEYFLLDQDVKWPQVTRLDIIKTEDMPWGRLHLPQIQSLSLIDFDTLPAAASSMFLKSHSNLREIFCMKICNGISNIAAAAQVTRLSIPASEAKLALQFHHLDNLLLFQHANFELDMEALEAIVERHFPPSNLPDKVADTVRAELIDHNGAAHGALSISCPVNLDFSCNWRICPSILRKEEIIIEVKRETQDYWVYVYF
jgi:hypothetical protein